MMLAFLSMLAFICLDHVACSGSGLPFLFMTQEDIQKPWGLQWPVTSGIAANLSAGPLNYTKIPDYAKMVVQGGLMMPNPNRPEAGFELFYEDKLPTESKKTSNTSLAIFFVTTTDFITYSSPVQVGELNAFNETSRQLNPKLVGCVIKSIARSDDGHHYCALTICNDAGVRPMVATWPLHNSTSFSPQQLVPAFWDHDDLNLIWDNTSRLWVDIQITFENQPSPLKYCDNVGLPRCALGYRRVITLRTSHDGLQWGNDMACPSEHWDPSHTQHFDPQFRNCTPGWNLAGMIVPDGHDPPELEFYKLMPYRIYGTTRVIGHALLYAPAPQADLGPNYGLGDGDCPRANKSTNVKDLRACHGPHMNVERWIGPRDGNLTRTPLQTNWVRPFRLGPSSPRGGHLLTLERQETFTRGGIMLAGHHVWLSHSRLYPYLLGVPQFRFSGMYAPANAEFSTPPFVFPEAGMWINADAHWDRPPDGYGQHCDQGCASYVMVEVWSVSGDVVPGFERRKCVFMDADGPRLPLKWNGTSTASLRGREVQLRVFYRDATVFAIGAFD